MCMPENKAVVIKCSRCLFKWEIVRGGHTFKVCERCREKNRERYRNRSAEIIQKILARCRHKYNTNEPFRLQRITDVSALLKSTVVCSECDKVMNYGSLLKHKKNAARDQKQKRHYRSY